MFYMEEEEKQPKPLKSALKKFKVVEEDKNEVNPLVSILQKLSTCFCHCFIGGFRRHNSRLPIKATAARHDRGDRARVTRWWLRWRWYPCGLETARAAWCYWAMLLRWVQLVRRIPMLLGEQVQTPRWWMRRALLFRARLHSSFN